MSQAHRAHGLKAAVVIGLGWLAVHGPAAGAEPITGTVPADWPIDAPALVAVPVPKGRTTEAEPRLELRVEGDNRPARLVGQYEPPDDVGGIPGRVWFLWQAEPQQRGRQVTLRLTGSNEPKPPAYRSRYDDPSLHVETPGGKPILSYWHGRPEPGNRYPITSFIHPLIGLDGEVLTACQPDDHLHQRALFWAWVRHEVRGQPIGNWWQPTHIQADSAALTNSDGPIFSRFAARHFWVHVVEAGDRRERFIDERVVCRVFATTPAGRAIDVDLTLTALADGVRIGGTVSGKKGYGGFTLRFGAAKDVKLEADGKVIEKDNVNQLRAAWTAWNGRFVGPDGRPAAGRSGGAIFVHPSHPNHPPPWITRRYGPMGVAYPGLDMLDIPKNKPLRLRYRVWIHRGDATAGKAVAVHGSAGSREGIG